MTTLKPYPAYRDSGIEWLGDVPEHWDVRRLKQAIQMNYGDSLASNARDDTGAVIVAGSNGRVGRHEIPNTCGPAIVVGRKGSYGKANWFNEPVYAIDTTFFIDASTTRQNLRWVYWVLQELRLDSYTKDAAVPGLDRNDAYERLLSLPPLPEQRAIADFLDAMDARITRFIAARKKMIRLLEEKKQAVINQAVTRGLDPDVPMKDSGVDWLGDIPAHWEVRRLKTVVCVPLQYGANESGDVYRGDWPRYVRITDIAPNGELRAETTKSLEPYLLHQGDVLLARSGATVGKSFIYRRSWGIAGFAGYLIRARLDTSQISPEYFKRYTESAMYWSWIKASSIQATIENVSAEKYGRLEIPLPPTAEQKDIVKSLDCETTRTDAVIDRSSQEIELMQEFRSRLISDVVTGRLDVRGVDLGELPEFDEIPETDDAVDPDDDESLFSPVNDHIDDKPKQRSSDAP